MHSVDMFECQIMSMGLPGSGKADAEAEADDDVHDEGRRSPCCQLACLLSYKEIRRVPLIMAPTALLEQGTYVLSIPLHPAMRPFTTMMLFGLIEENTACESFRRIHKVDICKLAHMGPPRGRRCVPRDFLLCKKDQSFAVCLLYAVLRS